MRRGGPRLLALVGTCSTRPTPTGGGDQKEAPPILKSGGTPPPPPHGRGRVSEALRKGLFYAKRAPVSPPLATDPWNSGGGLDIRDEWPGRCQPQCTGPAVLSDGWVHQHQIRPYSGYSGGLLARRARPGHLFDHSPPVPVSAPPPPLHQTIWSTFSPCLRIWPILCTQFIMMARVGVGMVGVTLCVVEFSYFGFCNVFCTEGLQASAVYLGDFPRWGYTWGQK